MELNALGVHVFTGINKLTTMYQAAMVTINNDLLCLFGAQFISCSSLLIQTEDFIPRSIPQYPTLPR